LIARRQLLLGLAATSLATASCAGGLGARREAQRAKPMPGRRFVVVGAGIAGLSAAKRLRDSGAEVTVVESLERAGGRVYSVRRPAWDGAQELGAQYFNDHYTSLLPLFDAPRAARGAAATEDASEPLIATLDGLTAIVVDGRPVTVDAAHPRTYITRGVIGFRDALTVAFAFADVASAVRTLPLGDFRRWEADDDEDAVSWMVRTYGPRATNYVGVPGIESLFFFRASEMSAAAFKWMIANADRAGRWYTSPASNFAAATRVMTHLASSGVTFRLGTSVELVTQDGARRVHVAIKDGEALIADGVVVTAPGPAAHRLLKSPSPAQAAIFAQGSASTIVINVVVNEPSPELRRDGRVYGVSIPRVENPSGLIAAFSVESGKTNLSHGGHELYGFHLHDAAARGLLERSDDAIVQEVLAEAERFIPNVRTGLVDAVVQRWPFAIPRMAVGHATRCRQLWDEQASSDSRIVLAGDQTSVATMDGAAWSGLRAAEILEEKLAG
jgi:oxygen-dependent protoporphyrinogen oxidase